MSSRIIKILMERDKISEEEARRTVKFTKELISEAGSLDEAQDIIENELGLELDYLEELL